MLLCINRSFSPDREPERDHTYVIYALLTAYALKWDFLVTEWGQWLSTGNHPKSRECVDRSWHLYGQKWSQIHSTSREQGGVFPGPWGPPKWAVQHESAKAASFNPKGTKRRSQPIRFSEGRKMHNAEGEYMLQNDKTGNRQDRIWNKVWNNRSLKIRIM